MSRKRQRDHYAEFAEELTGVMQRDFPDVCFYVYGSFARGEHDARKGSDIGGGFVFPEGVVLQQDRILALGAAIADIHDRHRVKLQFNLMDRAAGNDGRFLAYSEDFTLDIARSGRVLSGPDLRGELRGLQYKHSSLNSAAFDLRKVRNFLLFAPDHYRINRELFGRKAHSVVTAAVKFPKKLVLLRTDSLVTNASDARQRLGDLLGCGMDDFAQLERFATVPEEDLQRNYNLGIALYCGAAGAVERTVQTYLDKFPGRTEREARC